MRLFVAAELPDAVLDALAETSAFLRGSVPGRYVAPDSFHVTLAFLDEVEGRRVDDAIDAIEGGCEGFRAFEVALGDFGSFGRRSAATLWQGFREAGDLPAVAASVRSALREAGFSFDEKSFLAHVTLMRAADLAAVSELPMPHIAHGTIDTVTLFSSDLSGEHPVYEPLHAVRLG